jgi:hypothetical protein
MYGIDESYHLYGISILIYKFLVLSTYIIQFTFYFVYFVKGNGFLTSERQF